MPKERTISMRVAEDWFARISRAAEKLGYAKGDTDKGVSQFVRQASTEKANKVLGLKPTLPVYVADKDKN